MSTENEFKVTHSTPLGGNQLNSIRSNNQSSTQAELPTQNQQLKSDQLNASRAIQKSAQASENNTSNTIPSNNLEQATNEVREFITANNRNISFEVDNDSGSTVITIRDSENQEVIRQIPDQEIRQIADRIRSLRDQITSSSGVFIEKQV